MEAPNRHEFCRLIAEARTHKLAGSLSGSAFRQHPVMLFRRDVLLVNQWHVDDYCYAEAFTVRPVKFKPWSNDPLWTGGNPYPHPEEGSAIRFFDGFSGWRVEGPWQQIMLEVLDEVRAEIEVAKRAAEEKLAAQRASQAAAQADLIADASSLYGRSA